MVTSKGRTAITAFVLLLVTTLLNWDFVSQTFIPYPVILSMPNSKDNLKKGYPLKLTNPRNNAVIHRK